MGDARGSRFEKAAIVHVVDDDDVVSGALADLFASMGYRVARYRQASEFLEADRSDLPGCVVSDIRLPGMSGLELQAFLTRSENALPVIFMTGFGDIQMSVKGMKAGAVDFLTKPFRDQDMLDAVRVAIERNLERRRADANTLHLRQLQETLSLREREVMDLVVAGAMNKQIAFDLKLSEITVKVHRASVMRKMGVRSVAELSRIAERLTPSN